MPEELYILDSRQIRAPFIFAENSLSGHIEDLVTSKYGDIPETTLLDRRAGGIADKSSIMIEIAYHLMPHN